MQGRIHRQRWQVSDLWKSGAIELPKMITHLFQAIGKWQGIAGYLVTPGATLDDCKVNANCDLTREEVGAESCTELHLPQAKKGGLNETRRID